MVNIQFDEDQEYQHSVVVEKKSLFIRIVLSTGLVSDEKQAEYVLLGLAIFGIILAFLIPSFLGGGHASPPPLNQIDFVAGPNALTGQK